MNIENNKQEFDKFINGDINEYDILSHSERNAQNRLNVKNHYGMSKSLLISLIRKHKKARKEFDIKTLAKIEYRLTDINFHSECAMLHNGNYDEAMQLVSQW